MPLNIGDELLDSLKDFLTVNFEKYIGDLIEKKQLTTQMLNSWDWWLDTFLPEHEQEIPNRYLIVRDFTNIGDINLHTSATNILALPAQEWNQAFPSYSTSDFTIKNNQPGPLIGAVINPFGAYYRYDHVFEGKGYSEEVCMFNDSLLSLFNQYIYRSYFINVIGAINVIYERSAQFMGYSISTIPINQHYELPQVKPETAQEKDVFTLLETINAIDPHINRAIYYLNAALEFRNQDYSFCITPLENCVTVISDLILDRIHSKEPRHPKRIAQAARVLNLPDEDLTVLNDLYRLRNHQTSHPSNYQWWDLNEYAQSFMEEDAFPLVINMLRAACEYEQNHRIFENEIDSWPSVLSNHGAQLLKLIWGNAPEFHINPKNDETD